MHGEKKYLKMFHLKKKKKKTLLLQLAKVCKTLYFLLSSLFSPVMSKLFLEQKEDFPI